MQVEKVLYMKKGDDNNSYAKSSMLQRKIATQARPIIEESIRELYNTLTPDCIMMADMGCSSGPNALLVVSRIIDVIGEACKSTNHQCPQLAVFLNDLPGNDFNALFTLLPRFEQALVEAKGGDFRPCFVSGIPKSFYGRVFPDKFLHFVHSLYSVNWLSQVPRGLLSENGEPLNKGNIYIAKTSPQEVSKLYNAQFQRDFTLFLRSRSMEMVSGGRMVLIFQGSYNSEDPDSLLELLGSTLNDMVSKGVIKQEKLDGFNMPFYAPTVEEVRKLVQAEGSFVLDKLETFTVDWSVDTSQTLETRAKFVAKTMRAVTESLLVTAFSYAVMDDLFLWFETRVRERMAVKRGEYVTIVLSVTNKD